MSNPHQLENNLRDRRGLRGWSQEQLARRSGLSRAGISAIETDRLVPSAAAALALAAALECRVEDLFRLRGALARESSWAWSPSHEPCRIWRADLGGTVKVYPAEATASGVIPHDGVYRDGSFQGEVLADPAHTLVMASCDPAAGLLATELARTASVRLIALPRSSRAALSLVGRGLVHVGGVHLTPAGQPGGNAAIVERQLGSGYHLLRIARWEEGIACGPGLRLRSVRDAVATNVRWVGREDGSGARQCLDELFGNRRPPRRVASDHRGVVEAVRGGWADAGVCLRFVTEEAGLHFLPVREESYDLCIPDRWEGDHRVQALLRVVRSPSYRGALGELPGYDSAQTGELYRVS